MRRRAIILLVVWGLTGAGSSRAATVTRSQLLEMARAKVDAKVMLAIVQRDCVDFPVDGTNAAELSREVPAEVLEAAIRCRETTAAGVAASAAPAPASERAGEANARSAAAARPSAQAPGSEVAGQLRVRADFIGEPEALTCTCLLDGRPFATLTKPAQGDFGQAVARDPIRRESELVPVPAGRHNLLARCDPHDQELVKELDVRSGQRITVEIGETMFRHWKIRRVRAN